MTQFCPNCGKPNTDTITQCVACGLAFSTRTLRTEPKRRVLSDDEAYRLAQRFFEAMCGAMGNGDGKGYCDQEEHDIFIHMPRCRGYEAMGTERGGSCDCRAVALRVAGRQVVEVKDV